MISDVVFVAIPVGDGLAIPVVLILLLLAATYFTIYFGFPNFTRFGLAVDVVRGKYDSTKEVVDSNMITRDGDIPDTIRVEGGIGEVKMPLIADVSKDVAKKYRCLVKKGDDKGVALRATFIIDDKGVLRHMSYNDLPVGRNVDETVRLVKAFKYSDEFGEVCPSKWKKKGDKAMKPSHKEKQTQEYWNESHK